MAIDSEGIDQVVKKICSSSMFARSRRLQRFLAFVSVWPVEHPNEPLKEYAIALGVYDKPSSFDPQADPIVRVEAGRLRSRLAEYYAGPGYSDPWIIELPKGSYTPFMRARTVELSRPQTESIAVIPSADSPDQDVQYLANGISEGITRRLAQIPSLRVAPWTMVLRLQTPEQDLPRTAEALRVRTLFVVRLIARADKCDVHVEWINPAQREHLWGARYPRQLHDLHDLEDEIALDLAERLAPHLSRTQMAEIRQQSSTNGRAYELYLKGRHLWNKRTVDTVTRAIHHYQRALDYDAGFAPALGGIADCYLILGTFTFMSPAVSMPRAKSAATRALELDPGLGEVRATLACIRFLYDWNWDEAEREFQRAIASAPKSSVARQWYGASLCAIGRFAAGRKQLRAALELDPLSPMIGTQVGVGFYIDHKYGDAIREFTHVLDLDPYFWAAWHFLGACELSLGRLDAALANLQKALELSGESPFVQASLGHALARSGREGDAERVLDALRDRPASEYVPPYGMALICCGLGRHTDAMTWLEQAFAERSPAIALWLRGEPRLDPIRGETRFERMLQGAGLA